MRSYWRGWLQMLEIKTVDRPDSVALVTEIERVIDEIATDKMTIIEVLGVLDFVAIRFAQDSLG